MNLDLRTLQLFVAVVEERTVAKAAKREHIAASAVSKRIADFEGVAGRRRLEPGPVAPEQLDLHLLLARRRSTST